MIKFMISESRLVSSIKKSAFSHECLYVYIPKGLGVLPNPMSSFDGQHPALFMYILRGLCV